MEQWITQADCTYDYLVKFLATLERFHLFIYLFLDKVCLISKLSQLMGTHKKKAVHSYLSLFIMFAAEQCLMRKDSIV